MLCAADANVTELSINHGPTVGNTVVTVRGHEFQNISGLLFCKFDSTLVVATYVASTSVVCKSPPHSTGPVLVEVTNNNQDFTTDATVFTFEGRLCVRLICGSDSQLPAC